MEVVFCPNLFSSNYKLGTTKKCANILKDKLKADISDIKSLNLSIEVMI